MSRLQRFPALTRLLWGIPCVIFPVVCGVLATVPAAQARQTLRVAVAYAPKTLDPALAADAAAARLLQLTNPALLQYNAQFQPVPLVGSCSQPALTRVTCTLPSGRTFHDGTALTAPTLKGWFTSLQTNARSPFSSVLKGVNVAASASNTLTFTLPAPTLTFLNKLTEIPLAPSPTAVQSTAPLSARAGLGLYKLATADALGNVTLQSTATTTAPQVLQFLFVQDATTRLLKLKKNEVDVVQNDLPPELFTWGRKQGWPALAVPSSSYSYLGLNFKNQALANPQVRAGLAHAVNRPAIRRYLLGGLAAPASSLLPPGHPLAWAAPEEPFDAMEAEDTLDPVLFRGPADDGSADVRTTLTLLTSTDALSQRVAQVIQSNMREAGIQLRIQPTEWGAFFDKVRKGQFDMVLLSWTGDQPPEFLYYAFHSSQTPPNGLNRGHVKDALLDKHLEAIMAATTPQQLAAATTAAQQRIAVVRPYLPLYRRHHTLITSPAVQGCGLTTDGGYKGLLACTFR